MVEEFPNEKCKECGSKEDFIGGTIKLRSEHLVYGIDYWCSLTCMNKNYEDRDKETK